MYSAKSPVSITETKLMRYNIPTILNNEPIPGLLQLHEELRNRFKDVNLAARTLIHEDLSILTIFVSSNIDNQTVVSECHVLDSLSSVPEPCLGEEMMNPQNT